MTERRWSSYLRRANPPAQQGGLVILRMNRRYLVTVRGVKFCYIIIRTRKDQMIWQGWLRTGLVSFTLEPKGKS